MRTICYSLSTSSWLEHVLHVYITLFKRLWILIRQSIASFALSTQIPGRVFLYFELKGLDGWITFKFVIRKSASVCSSRFGIIPRIIQRLLVKCTSSEVVPSLKTPENQKGSKEVPLLPNLYFFFHTFHIQH